MSLKVWIYLVFKKDYYPVREFGIERYTLLYFNGEPWGWCTGTTQRDGMGREEGGGFRMGNTCIPVADSF